MENVEVAKGDIPFREMELNAGSLLSKAFEAQFDTTSSQERAGWANTTFGRQETEFPDHLPAANARFMIIEFKVTLEAIGAEAGKSLRKMLFHELVIRRDLIKRCLGLYELGRSAVHTRDSRGIWMSWATSPAV